MTRVSENSASNSINYSVSRTKAKLEDLQIKGSNLKRIQKPSDDPIGNTELLSIRSSKADGTQFGRNANFAKTQLEMTENAISDLTDVVMRAKEIALAQSSNIHDPSVRKSVAEEVNQLRNQSLSIANRQLANRYLFAGHKTQTKPFDQDGNYHGDNGKSYIEVNKDFFVEANLNGKDLFSLKSPAPTTPSLQLEEENEAVDMQRISRGLAGADEINSQKPAFKEKGEPNLFADLAALKNGLLTDNSAIIQNSLDRLDAHLSKMVSLRTQLGSTLNSIESTENHRERDQIAKEAYKSKIEDADVSELYSELSKQQATLDATYRSSSQMLNNSLLNFLK